MKEGESAEPSLFTIGHSDHDMPTLLALLSRHGITEIADVRSQPYSRFNAQFNRETFAECLNRAGINYVFLGRELGARRIERESYENKKARYDLISRAACVQGGTRPVATRDRISSGCSFVRGERSNHLSQDDPGVPSPSA